MRLSRLTFLFIIVLSISVQAAESPNVLFIAVDDLNDWIGCLDGHPQALTPNMDRLAKRGVLFTNAHCAAPACNPSRAAVFSGRMPSATGVWSNEKGQSLNATFPNAYLLPKAFKGSGYRTFGTGKLLHSRRKYAFDEYFSVEQRWSPLSKSTVVYTKKELPSKRTANPKHVVKHNGKHYTLPLNGMPSDRTPDTIGAESFDWGPFDVPDSEFGDTLITDWAIEKLSNHHDKPFFLGVGYYRPHQPLWAPQRFFDRFKKSPGRLPAFKSDDLDDLSDIAKEWALLPITSGSHATVVKFSQWQAAVEAYLACISYVDHEIGRLVDAFDNSKFGDNTVIVLWSDHGWHVGEKQHWGKWTGWERSTRVPLIVVPSKKMKQHFAVGQRCQQPVGLIDLYPTLVELCNVDGPDKLDGKSLVPLLTDPAQHTGRGVVTMFNPGNTSLRTERWRYIRYADGSEELYDLKLDPHEWHNLANSTTNRNTLEQLRDMVE